MGFLSKQNWRPPARPIAPMPVAPEKPSIKDVLKARIEVKREKDDPGAYAEIRRIMAMPIVEPLTPEEHEALCGEVQLAKEFDAGWRLFPPQSNGLAGYCTTGGLFGPIGVGWGKQLLTDMIAQAAHDKGVQRSLLLVPAQVYGQVWDRDIPWARKHVRITVPFFGLGRKAPNARLALAKTRRRGCYVMPYSCLSTKNTTDVIEALAPELIIADEADNLRNRTAARTKRVLEYCKEYKLRNGKRVEFVALSGTITRTKIRDYWHLLNLCLAENSPLPLTAQLADEWSMVLDSDAAPSAAQTGPIMPLVDFARKHFTFCKLCGGLGVVNVQPVNVAGLETWTNEKCESCEGKGRHTFEENVAGFRKAYKFRLVTSPGVVATSDNEIGTSLVLANVPVEKYNEHKDWPRLKQLIDQVEQAWLTPNGDEIEHAIHTYKWLWELSAGFYNELTWPDAPMLAERLRLSETHAEDRLERSKHHHALSQVYARELRGWLDEHSFGGCDTPLLVASYMAQHKAGPPRGDVLYDAWRDMHDADFEERIERDSRAVRVCDYKIQHAVEWARQLPRGEGGIVWYYNQEVGRWLADEFKAAGIEALHAPAGEVHNADIINPDNKDRVVLASEKAHGVGKNLQHFSNQIIVQTLRDASKMEQLLGRTHRNGQLASLLLVVTMHTLEFDKCNFAACLTDALYIHQTTSVRQKLIYCDYDPLPDVFPSEVLKERGFQNKILTPEQRKLFLDKFRPQEA